MSHGVAADAPALLEPSALKGFDELPQARRNLIMKAFTVGAEVAGMPYLYGGNGAKDGGFDCSGAMYAVLRKNGLTPPRTSSGQFLWVKGKSELHLVAESAEGLDDASFSELQPGDLVFWGRNNNEEDGIAVKITHVGMFLGFEKKDGRAVMINATDGRSYRGKKGNGYGVYDFRVPRKGNKTQMVGYGTPPGLE